MEFSFLGQVSQQPLPNWAEIVSAVATALAVIFAFIAWLYSRFAHQSSKERYEQDRRTSSPIFSVSSWPSLHRKILLYIESMIDPQEEPVICKNSPSTFAAEGFRVASSNPSARYRLLIQNDNEAVKLRGWRAYVSSGSGIKRREIEMLEVKKIDNTAGGGYFWILDFGLSDLREQMNIEFLFETTTGFIDTHNYELKFLGRGNPWLLAEIKRKSPTSVTSPDSEYLRTDQLTNR